MRQMKDGSPREISLFDAGGQCDVTALSSSSAGFQPRKENFLLSSELFVFNSDFASLSLVGSYTSVLPYHGSESLHSGITCQISFSYLV